MCKQRGLLNLNLISHLKALFLLADVSSKPPKYTLLLPVPAYRQYNMKAINHHSDGRYMMEGIDLSTPYSGKNGLGKTCRYVGFLQTFTASVHRLNGKGNKRI